MYPSIGTSTVMHDAVKVLHAQLLKLSMRELGTFE